MKALRRLMQEGRAGAAGRATSLTLSPTVRDSSKRENRNTLMTEDSASEQELYKGRDMFNGRLISD